MRGRNPHPTRFLGTLLLFSLAACTSKDNTELVVTVWSDFLVPDEMNGVRIRVAGEKDTKDHPFPLAAATSPGRYTIPVQLALVPAAAKDLSINVSAIGSLGGTDMVWQEASLPFIPGQARELVLYLARSCKNVTCDDHNFTCDTGACTRPVAVQTAALPVYVPGQAAPVPDASVPTAKPDAGVPFDVARDTGQDGTNVELGAGGATPSGGLTGSAGTTGTGGNAGSGGRASSEGNVAGGGIVGRGGTAGTGGTIMTGGLLSKGGASGSGASSGTGGVGGNGGVFGTGGNTTAGCSPACTIDQDCIGGACVPTPTYGGTCTTVQTCPANTTCCDGSNEHCDGVRLPTSDGTDSGEFAVSADGLTVTDTITGLIWQRDGSGSRAGCSGSGSLTCTWAEAKAYCSGLSLGGIGGWRLPAYMELSTIVDFTQANPAIDQTIFPNAPLDSFWTSSVYVGTSGFSWYISSGGTSHFYAQSGNFRTRCVSGSRCFPQTRFRAGDGGLVYDTLTRLVWQQQSSSTTMSWADAKHYCSSLGLRLPTLKELLSIMNLTSGVSIDEAAFPATPATPTEYFWTSTPCADSTLQAWKVNFLALTGGANCGTVDTMHRARCAR